jgi:hypothetical protein
MRKSLWSVSVLAVHHASADIGEQKNDTSVGGREPEKPTTVTPVPAAVTPVSLLDRRR